MPTNRIQVEYEEGAATCKVWDGDGIEHDVTGIFQQLRDLATKDRSSTFLWLTSNALGTCIELPSATKKELSFEVEAAVIQQILQML